MPITTTPSGTVGEYSTYTPIYSTTLSSATASVTFSNIPTTFTDLIIASSNVTTSVGSGFISLRFNGDSSSLYSNTYMTGNGTSATSGRNSGTVAYIIGDTDTTNQTMSINHIMNYSNTTTFKTIISRCGYASASTQAFASLWRSTSPITSITLYGNGNINSGSQFTIYGIKAAAPAPKATGGDVVVTDGTYWYHAFKTTGLFDVKQSLTADVLIVAGGGAGGSNQGGGGGAGGVLAFSSQSLALQGYTVTVGGGGASSGSANANGTSGTNTTFGSLTAAVGGGRGGGVSGSAGANGGSGGGSDRTYTGSAATGTSGQGNNGGVSDGTTTVSAGGGGAGGVGTNGTSAGTGGSGGGGVNTVTNWGALSTALTSTGLGSSGYIAGGGGGGIRNNGLDGSVRAGGTGGGGSGGGTPSSTVPTAGTTNTGSGGGGGSASGSTDSIGASGGSGLVIVRYAV